MLESNNTFGYQASKHALHKCKTVQMFPGFLGFFGNAQGYFKCGITVTRCCTFFIERILKRVLLSFAIISCDKTIPGIDVWLLGGLELKIIWFINNGR
jgi:hypothetical protein